MLQNLNLKLEYYDFILPAIEDSSHFVVVPAGRQVGKTYNIGMWLIDEGIHNAKLPMLWVDTTQRNINKYVQRVFRPIIGDSWHLFDWNKQEKVLMFPNGSYIDFGSAQEPENLEGQNYKRFVLNEAGIILKKKDLWDNTLYAMIKSDNCFGKIIGTPKGRGKFQELYTKGLRHEDGYSSYHYTYYDSPNYTESERGQILRNLPERVIQQEYMAEFLDDAGMVFRKIKNAIMAIASGHVTGHNYVMGVDLAKSEDFTVITIIDQATKQVVYRDRFNAIDWTLQKGRIFSCWNMWGKPSAIIDATGVGSAIFDDLKSLGMTVEPFIFTNASKKELIENLAVAFENEEIKIPDDEQLINELELFGYEVSKSGNVTYSAPDGYHDDSVISLALAWRLIKQVVNISVSWV